MSDLSDLESDVDQISDPVSLLVDEFRISDKIKADLFWSCSELLIIELGASKLKIVKTIL